MRGSERTTIFCVMPSLGTPQVHRKHTTTSYPSALHLNTPLSTTPLHSVFNNNTYITNTSSDTRDVSIVVRVLQTNTKAAATAAASASATAAAAAAASSGDASGSAGEAFEAMVDAGVSYAYLTLPYTTHYSSRRASIGHCCPLSSSYSHDSAMHYIHQLVSPFASKHSFLHL